MDELSRDLMRGEGGLQALNGDLDGNLGQWARGEAAREMADAGQPREAPDGLQPVAAHDEAGHAPGSPRRNRRAPAADRLPLTPRPPLVP